MKENTEDIIEILNTTNTTNMNQEELDLIPLDLLLNDGKFLNDPDEILDLSLYNPEDVWWFNEESKDMLNRGYLLRGETLFDAIHRICTSASKYFPDIQNIAYKHFVRNIVLGWQSFSSPIWANMGVKRGLPISCFNVHIPDSIDGIFKKLSEVGMQTKLGGGTSAYFGEVRGRGSVITNNGKSSGSVSFMQIFDTVMNVVSQGATRKGAFAGYLDIDHPDIEEFLTIKDIGSPIQNIFYGVCVPDYWMRDMIDGNEEKRKIWAKVLESRQQKGLPYILFTDNMNRNKPEIYKELGLKIRSSNLCSEVSLPSSENESFVCCLSSMNLELFDDWKDTDAVYWATYFLDAVMSEFIEKSEHVESIKSSYNFAKRHRAIGLGVMGYHSYLQKNMIPFESWEAKMFNAKAFKEIWTETRNASIEMAEKYGPAPIFDELLGNKETEEIVIPMRNTTTMAIAPTTSSSSILGQVSPGIEPYSSNYYKAGLAKGNYMRTNKYLKKLLQDKEMDNEDVWYSILINKGSVQHLNFLSDEEKNIFKTFKEISPKEILVQAAQRQQFIDQMQSLNLLIPSELPIKDVNQLIISAWETGIKALYYQRSTSVSKELLTNFVICESCSS